MKSINFLKDHALFIRKKTRKVLFIRTLSVAALAIYSLFIVFSFSYYLLVKKESDVLEQKIKQEESVIEGLRSIETKQVYLAVKTKSLSKILSSKKQHQQIVESILAILPEGMSVNNFQIAEDGRITFFASCLNFKVLESFLEILETENNSLDLKVKEAQIKSLSYGLGREYAFKLSALFYLEEE